MQRLYSKKGTDMKKTQINEKQHREFGMMDNVSYAAGDLGSNMSFALKGTMAIFWTQYMKLDLWYSLLLVVVQIWDAINDPLIGAMIDADRRKYKRNKFLAYVWVGSIGLSVAGALCFIPLPNAPVWAKIAIPWQTCLTARFCPLSPRTPLTERRSPLGVPSAL